tara:strand:- start:1713 stop:2153 length:441 start_codon:yes stop_codon:yes gene_type:complete
MKFTDVIYINAQHEKVVEKHIIYMKRCMYFATETARTGKFQDFLNILETIYMYSNNFYKAQINKKNCTDGAIQEFMFLIPNMTFYSAIGFLSALKNDKNQNFIRESLEKVAKHCENTTSELADILIDQTERDELFEEIFNKEITKN